MSLFRGDLLLLTAHLIKRPVRPLKNILRRHALNYLGLNPIEPALDPIAEANSIAVSRAIKAERERIRSQGPIGFVGQRCGCAGWDGDSPRCLCGKHLVNWEYQGSFLVGMQVYGEASN